MVSESFIPQYLKKKVIALVRDAEIRVSRVGARRLQVPEIVLGSLTRI